MAASRSTHETLAVAMVARHFGDVQPAPDTSRAQPGTVVDPNGLVFAGKCGCGLHKGPERTRRSHDAKPIARAS